MKNNLSPDPVAFHTELLDWFQGCNRRLFGDLFQNVKGTLIENSLSKFLKHEKRRQKRNETLITEVAAEEEKKWEKLDQDFHTESPNVWVG